MIAVLPMSMVKGEARNGVESVSEDKECNLHGQKSEKNQGACYTTKLQASAVSRNAKWSRSGFGRNRMFDIRS